MRTWFSRPMITAAIATVAVAATISVSITRISAQSPAVPAKTSAPAATSASALKTAWGEPDLQAIWTDESDTPLERSRKYANHEFFTEVQRAELDKERAALLGRGKRVERGTEHDVPSAYNAQFMSGTHTGSRTSVVD